MRCFCCLGCHEAKELAENERAPFRLDFGGDEMKTRSLFAFAILACLPSAFGSSQQLSQAPEFRQEEWLRLIDDIRGSDPKLRLDAAKELDRKTQRF